MKSINDVPKLKGTHQMCFDISEGPKTTQKNPKMPFVLPMQRKIAWKIEPIQGGDQNLRIQAQSLFALGKTPRVSTHRSR